MKLSRAERITVSIVGIVLALAGCAVVVLLGLTMRPAMPAATPVPTMTAEPKATAVGLPVEVLDAVGTLSDSGRCVTVEGEVKNTSQDVDIAFLEVIVTYYDSADGFLSTDFSYAEYQLIRPGQVSPFKVFSCFDRASEFEFYRLGFQTLTPLN